MLNICLIQQEELYILSTTRPTPLVAAGMFSNCLTLQETQLKKEEEMIISNKEIKICKATGSNQIPVKLLKVLQGK